MDFFQVRVRRPFPHLTDANHRKTSPETPSYNCFGWAILSGEVLMGPKKGWLWPDNVPSDLRMSSFVQALASYGFEPCPTGDLEPAFEKIVLYGSGEIVTHAARQLDTGRWTSKLGIFGDDIEHDTPEAISGGEYYAILAYFRRHRPAV